MADIKDLTNEQLAIALLHNDKRQYELREEYKELQKEIKARLESGKLKFWEGK